MEFIQSLCYCRLLSNRYSYFSSCSISDSYFALACLSLATLVSASFNLKRSRLVLDTTLNSSLPKRFFPSRIFRTGESKAVVTADVMADSKRCTFFLPYSSGAVLIKLGRLV